MWLEALYANNEPPPFCLVNVAECAARDGLCGDGYIRRIEFPFLGGEEERRGAAEQRKDDCESWETQVDSARQDCEILRGALCRVRYECETVQTWLKAE